MTLPQLPIEAGIALLLLSVLGFLILIIALVVDGSRRERAALRRRPAPYPGCPACRVALAIDPQGWEDPLERHQAAEHARGVRWW